MVTAPSFEELSVDTRTSVEREEEKEKKKKSKGVHWLVGWFKERNGKVRLTTKKEAGDNIGVLLTETMASNLANEEVVNHRSTTVASRRTHGRRLAGRATRRQIDGKLTVTPRRGIGQLVGTGSYRARDVSG
ncbi:hypothetical protein LWI29_012879 [Acer saccharum]|uniref:Uncharacterized protein n=1 Tax=Acer saccharum TaxID=4024 RepID=A0AA39W5D1_ACESA|nr:hypothetical protein LWI29_012879 [Acer saccharum]